MADSYADIVRRGMAMDAPSRYEGMVEVDGSMISDEIDWDLVAAFTYAGRNAPIHPRRVLPPGFLRSAAGFLVDNNLVVVEVDQEVVRRAREDLMKHSAIAYFVGGISSYEALKEWAAELQEEIGDSVSVGRMLGKGFLQLRTTSPDTTEKVLQATPHRSRWGTCIIQQFKPLFQPSNETQLTHV